MFIDNDAARASLAKSFTRKEEGAAITFSAVQEEERLRVNACFLRVPTASNIADGPSLKLAFDQHSHQPGITLPIQWTDAAGLLKEKLYELIRPQLRWVPQFAYQPGRDLYDALARVQIWIENFKKCYGKGNGSKFAQREREEKPDNKTLCVGGAILSLDLKQAFDRVNRQALATSLRGLGADENVTAAIISLLDTSRYHIISDQQHSSVGTTRGIRQGCKIAPMLWVAISTLLLERLGDALSGPHGQATT